ncbi:hypothetical protein QR680_007165 [Steinernema hermaphroditum]|uniref:G-protein coupled receptors family 1 profile domain-containing protein n=1 Tax=Steinernema hermaphroditum TaxID=289476 RepID=A0AA39LYN6_9BILA|nr:hypothetical protein QR680_007165 [Steinernema hermaphroditum]
MGRSVITIRYDGTFRFFNGSAQIMNDAPGFEDSGWASLMITSAGVAGLIINSWILFKVLWQNAFGRSFGWIWVSRGIAYCCSSLMFTLFIGPGWYLYPKFLETDFGTVIYQTAIFASTLAIVSNLLIAANRCLLISIPFTYKEIFSERKTMAYIGLTWLFSIASIIIPFIIPACEDNSDGFVVYEKPSLDCSYIFQLVIFIAVWIAVMATLVADILAIYKINKMSKIRDALTSSQAESEVLRRGRERQLSMCYMIIVQSILCPMTMFSLCFGAAIPNNMLRFLLTDFLWALVDPIDGLVVIIFNKNMRTFNAFQPHSKPNSYSMDKVNDKFSSALFALLRGQDGVQQRDVDQLAEKVADVSVEQQNNSQKEKKETSQK